MNRHKLQDDNFRAKYGSAYEGLKEVDGKYIFHTLFFFYRRLMIISCLIYFDSMIITQYLIIALTGLGVVMLLALREPFKSSMRNKAEILEECSTMVTMYHIFCFTEFISDSLVKHGVGYSLIVSIVLHLFFFLGALAFFFMRRQIRILAILYYKRKSKKQASKWRPGKSMIERRELQGRRYRHRVRKQKRRDFKKMLQNLSSSSSESDSPVEEPEEESKESGLNALDKPIQLANKQTKPLNE